MINYEIITIDLHNHEMQVKYSKDDKVDFFLWIYFGEQPEVTESFLHAEASKGGEAAQNYWDMIDARTNELSELEAGMTTKTGTAKTWITDTMPEFNDFIHEVREVVTEEENNFRKSWELVELTSDQKATAIRKRRDALLADTDIECLSDRTPSQELLDYRQALRDISNQTGFPSDITWPIKPSAG